MSRVLTPFHPPHLDCRLSTHVLATSHRCLLPKKTRLGFPLLRLSFSALGIYRSALDLPCSGLKSASSARLIVVTVRLPYYIEGQKVWLSTREISLKVDAPKIKPSFIGPYTIAKVINRSAVHLNLPRTLRQINPTFHMSRIKPFITELPDCALTASTTFQTGGWF